MTLKRKIICYWCYIITYIAITYSILLYCKKYKQYKIISYACVWNSFNRFSPLRHSLNKILNIYGECSMWAWFVKSIFMIQFSCVAVYTDSTSWFDMSQSCSVCRGSSRIRNYQYSRLIILNSDLRLGEVQPSRPGVFISFQYRIKSVKCVTWFGVFTHVYDKYQLEILIPLVAVTCIGITRYIILV